MANWLPGLFMIDKGDWFSGQVAACCGSQPWSQQEGMASVGRFSSCLSPASASQGMNPIDSQRAKGALNMSSLEISREGPRVDPEGQMKDNQHNHVTLCL